jgi:hypothetical protein
LLAKCTLACSLVVALVWEPAQTWAMPLVPLENVRIDSAKTARKLPIPAWLPPAARERVSRLGPDLQKEFECLALNIYWESRGEPNLGQLAVASVTLNRLVSPSFPKTICSVVKQGTNLGRNKCQFSWACDGQHDRPANDEAWNQAQRVAYRTLFSDLPDPTAGALYFHADYVRPDWSGEKELVSQIGRHIFYREGTGNRRSMDTAGVF